MREPNGWFHYLIDVNGLQRNYKVNKVQEISKENLTKIIIDNKDSMYRLAYSFLHNDANAQDAVSEAILIAFEKRYQIRKPEKARAWVMQIVANVSKQMLNKLKREMLTVNENLLEQATIFEGDSLWSIVMELSDELREVVVLYYYEQFSVREIGKMLDVPPGTVKSRLARAREKLSKAI